MKRSISQTSPSEAANATKIIASRAPYISLACAMGIVRTSRQNSLLREVLPIVHSPVVIRPRSAIGRSQKKRVNVERMSPKILPKGAGMRYGAEMTVESIIMVTQAMDATRTWRLPSGIKDARRDSGMMTTAIGPALCDRHRRMPLARDKRNAPSPGRRSIESRKTGIIERKKPRPVAQWLYRMKTGENVKIIEKSVA